jgi:hypothetical protein
MKIKREFSYILCCNNYVLTFSLVYILFVVLFIVITFTLQVDLSYIFWSHVLDIIRLFWVVIYFILIM